VGWLRGYWQRVLHCQMCGVTTRGAIRIDTIARDLRDLARLANHETRPPSGTDFTNHSPLEAGQASLVQMPSDRQSVTGIRRQSNNAFLSRLPGCARVLIGAAARRMPTCEGLGNEWILPPGCFLRNSDNLQTRSPQTGQRKDRLVRARRCAGDCSDTWHKSK
jgi:hypothetical protein